MDVLRDDLRGMWFIMLKDLRAYYFKPPNVSWGILFPFAFVLAFVIREDRSGDWASLVPGLLALTVLFGTTSMEAIVITFERRIGALERLLLAPLRLPALLAGKLLGGMAFGLATTAVVLVVALLVFGASGIHWPLLIGAALLSAAAFSALGALISVSVQEVFEAQTLANAFRFPMMFLGGVFDLRRRGHARCGGRRTGLPCPPRPGGVGGIRARLFCARLADAGTAGGIGTLQA
jgi:ABC-2 type transport system permease protein